MAEFPVYEGNEITLNEWPIGCEISTAHASILIRDPQDAKALVKSLQDYLKVIQLSDSVNDQP